MKKTMFAALCVAFAAAIAAPPANAQVPTVGGAPMYPNKTIPENASKASNLTTLVAAVKAAGLVDTLAGDGPFTVFAPVNSAFDALPDGTVANLLKPQNKASLQKVLTYHVVAGNYPRSRLVKMMRTSPDSLANLSTVEGGPISIGMRRGALVIYDESGDRYEIAQTDVTQANGVVHVIGGVLLPK